jgi:peptidoglycan-associated lipoprotein
LVGILALVLFAIVGCGGSKEAPVSDDTTQIPATEVIEQPEVTPEPPAPEPEPEPVINYGAMAPQEYGIEDVFFAFDEYTLSSESMATLEANARIIRQHADLTYVVEGHCDERGTVEYNLALGEKRAMAVRDYLVSLGVPSTQLRLTSYGEERPFAKGSNESAWALNRRGHFARP